MKTLRDLLDLMTQPRVTHGGPPKLQAAIDRAVDRAKDELGYVPGIVISECEAVWSSIHPQSSYYSRTPEEGGWYKSALLGRAEQNETVIYRQTYWRVDVTVGDGMQRLDVEGARYHVAREELAALLTSEDRNLERNAPSLAFEFVLDGRPHPDLHQEKPWSNTLFFTKATSELRQVACEIELFFRAKWEQAPQQVIYETPSGVARFNVRSPDLDLTEFEIQRALRTYSDTLEREHPMLSFDVRYEDRSLHLTPEVERYLEGHRTGFAT